MGTSAPAILSTGASKYSKLSSITDAHISAPMPCCGKPSSTVTRRLVFLTEAFIVALSNGRMERRFITSALIPSFASSRAASNA
eukprot:Gb_28291 [translate_table: standard]